MSQPYIVTVILNTNRKADTLACLASLAQSTYQRHQIIVLDNASSDGSAEAIKLAFPNVRIIGLTENLGYAGNNNVGIRAAVEQGADWIFVLNEDTIVDAQCIEQLCTIGESDPAVGIVGPMVYHYDEPTIIQSAGGRLGPYWDSWHIAQNDPDSGQFTRPVQVDWVSGCAMLVRRGLIEQVGMLDERFFYYWEETEWCVRASAHGWRILHMPAAHLWHKGVQRNYLPKPSVSYYNTRNRLLLMKKHHASLNSWLIAWMQIIRTLTSLSLKPKWRAKRAHRDAILQGTIDFLWQRWGRGSF